MGGFARAFNKTQIPTYVSNGQSEKVPSMLTPMLHLGLESVGNFLHALSSKRNDEGLGHVEMEIGNASKPVNISKILR
jgi:hypothetical protein